MDTSASPVFSFLVTTDNHMGYKEDDHIRRKDSYQAFQEALQIARDKDVDFILLGGDLFHMNRPSANIEHKCIKIIRQHMNAKDQVKIQPSIRRVAGKFSHFHKVDHANFEDPNLKVSYPIMTIHGNHDDPTGPRAQSICEKLATCGLLNYFGAVNQKDKEITIEPIVLQKEHLKIALYGLGFIPDYKLKSAFDKNLVTFIEPPKDTYNVLVVHQNRVPFSKHKVIPDELFPGFFHLVIRGHEHATLDPSPMIDSKVGGIVYQPGSTVATSISPSEAAPKKVGLIHVRQDDTCKKSRNAKAPYRMNYELLELNSCRSMIFKDIPQKEIFKYTKKVANVIKITADDYKVHSRDYVEQSVENLLGEFNKSESLKDDSNKKLPLVRVRLEYVQKEERFDELDIRSKFFPTRVANSDIVLFKKQKLGISNDGQPENITFADDDQEDDGLEDFDHINLGDEKRDTIDVMIDSYFRDQPADQRLQALSLSEYTNAVKGASEDGNVISKVLSKKKQDVLNKFKKEVIDEKVAQTKFHDEESVHKWFLKTFAQSDYKKLAGDYIDAIELSD